MPLCLCQRLCWPEFRLLSSLRQKYKAVHAKILYFPFTSKTERCVCLNFIPSVLTNKTEGVKFLSRQKQNVVFALISYLRALIIVFINKTEDVKFRHFKVV